MGDVFEVGFPTLENQSVDLIFTSVPDMNELGIDREASYAAFLSRCIDEFSRVIKRDGFIALAQTDRRIRGHILPKQLILSNALLEKGFLIKDHKILIKGRVDAVDPFILTYANLLVFTRRGTIPTAKRKGRYLRDCWVCKYEKYNGVWVWDEDFVFTVISTLSDRDDFVFDPFAGRGSVLRSCNKMVRRFLGVEKDPNIYSPVYASGGDPES